MKRLYAIKQIVGQRDNQEDYMQCLSEPTLAKGNDLLVLADGMGGYEGGEVASELVVEQFIESYLNWRCGSIVETLGFSLDHANTALADTISIKPEFKGMGCTFVAAHIDNGQLNWISVGDSPFWIYRNNKLTRLNQDHSMASVFKRMVALGEMSEEEAQNEPQRNTLRSAITGKDIILLDCPKESLSLQKGDILLLASDGLETLSNRKIQFIIQKNSQDMEQLTDELLNSVTKKNSPNQDNASVIAYKVSVPSFLSKLKKNIAVAWKYNRLAVLLAVGLSLSTFILFLQFKFNLISKVTEKTTLNSTYPQNNSDLEKINTTQELTPFEIPPSKIKPPTLGVTEHSLKPPPPIENIESPTQPEIKIPERFNQ